MKNKLVLRVQPIYTMLIWFFAVCCFVVLLFLAQIFGWETNGIENIIWYCLMGLCAITSLIILIYYIQFAYISEEGVILRGLFYPIVKLRWSDIHSIVSKRIMTYDNRTNVFLNWLVINLDNSDNVRGRAGRNRRKRSPWYIVATKRNVAIISKFIQIIGE